MKPLQSGSRKPEWRACPRDRLPQKEHRHLRQGLTQRTPVGLAWGLETSAVGLGPLLSIQRTAHRCGVGVSAAVCGEPPTAARIGNAAMARALIVLCPVC